MEMNYAYLAVVMAWYSASAMLIIWGIYKYMSNDEVKQLAHQVAVVMRYAEQSNLFLTTLKAELQTVPISDDTPSQSVIGRAWNRRRDDPAQTEQK